MQITLADCDLALIRSASAEVDTWHFNKWLILAICCLGFVALLTKATYDLTITGSLVHSAFNLGSSAAINAVILVWLKLHWGRTRREQVIDLIQARIADHDATSEVKDTGAREDRPG